MTKIRLIQYSKTEDEKMADIRFPDFGARRRCACRDAAAFGKRNQQDEVLQKDEKRQTNAPDENGSFVLRDELFRHSADSFRLDV